MRKMVLCFKTIIVFIFMMSPLQSQNDWKVTDSISLPGTQYPTHIAVHKNRAYISRNVNLVHVLDLSTKQLTDSITFGSFIYSTPGYIAFSGDSAYVTLSNLGSNGRLAVINTISNTVQSYVIVGADPYGAAAYHGKLYITNNVDWTGGDSSTVRVVDVNTLLVVDTIEVGKYPYCIINDSTTNKAYVSNSHSESKSVTVINLLSGDTIKTIPMYNQPRGMTITNGKVYVTNSVNSGPSPVKVIDINSDNVIQTIMTGRDAIGIASYRQYVFVANQSSYTLSVIDTSTNAVIATVPLGSDPYSVAVDPQNGKVYVTMQSARQIKVIENTAVGVSEKSEALPTGLVLFQNFPNPFNPSTVISYQLTGSGKVVLKIYNTLGQEVRTLVNDMKSAGYHTAVWDGKDNKDNMVSSGVYLYHISGNRFQQTKKLMIIR